MDNRYQFLAASKEAGERCVARNSELIKLLKCSHLDAGVELYHY